MLYRSMRNMWPEVPHQIATNQDIEDQGYCNLTYCKGCGPRFQNENNLQMHLNSKIYQRHQSSADSGTAMQLVQIVDGMTPGEATIVSAASWISRISIGDAIA